LKAVPTGKKTDRTQPNLSFPTFFKSLKTKSLCLFSKLKSTIIRLGPDFGFMPNDKLAPHADTLVPPNGFGKSKYNQSNLRLKPSYTGMSP
jgi:hypothetical protein